MPYITLFKIKAIVAEVNSTKIQNSGELSYIQKPFHDLVCNCSRAKSVKYLNFSKKI